LLRSLFEARRDLSFLLAQSKILLFGLLASGIPGAPAGESANLLSN
jgi:hypothetical protein